MWMNGLGVFFNIPPAVSIKIAIYCIFMFRKISTHKKRFNSTIIHVHVLLSGEQVSGRSKPLYYTIFVNIDADFSYHHRRKSLGQMFLLCMKQKDEATCLKTICV
ncbi:hypothetical protein EGW08_001858 [Elysia chlorotica]|uniref:Uncharacterized protein n=1 Tax=Elysia chlorotica TaxID=188477 RepID=A0A3S1CEB7_ELYCH|nr:hypothetical protein EGW08_001858 [Elysia chlorotica]